MKQYELIRAYKATESLSQNNKLSANALWGFYNLRKKLFPHWEFQNEREEAIRNKYIELANEDGSLTGKPYVDYLNELAELANIEKEINVTEKITVPLKDDMGITIEMMEALENFVEFTNE